MKVEDFKPCGGMALSNWGGIEIMLNDTNDAVIYSWYGKIAKRWQKIKFTKAGDAFLAVNGQRFYFKDFMFYR